MRENLIHNITILLEYSKLVQGMKLLYTNEEHFGLISLKTMSSLQIKDSSSSVNAVLRIRPQRGKWLGIFAKEEQASAEGKCIFPSRQWRIFWLFSYFTLIHLRNMRTFSQARPSIQHSPWISSALSHKKKLWCGS